MTVKLNLEPEVEQRLAAFAAERGLHIEAYLQELIEHIAARSNGGAERDETAANAPHVVGRGPADDRTGAATRALFARWAEEDKTDDPAEIEARNREFEEFKVAMNANRPGQRSLFP